MIKLRRSLGAGENPAFFLSRLRLFASTNFDPDSREGSLSLQCTSFSQALTRLKLQKLEKGLQTPQSELVDLNLNVSSNIHPLRSRIKHSLRFGTLASQERHITHNPSLST